MDGDALSVSDKCRVLRRKSPAAPTPVSRAAPKPDSPADASAAVPPPAGPVIPRALGSGPRATSGPHEEALSPRRWTSARDATSASRECWCSSPTRTCSRPWYSGVGRVPVSRERESHRSVGRLRDRAQRLTRRTADAISSTEPAAGLVQGHEDWDQCGAFAQFDGRFAEDGSECSPFVGGSHRMARSA
jgi:hypothetical protein